MYYNRKSLRGSRTSYVRAQPWRFWGNVFKVKGCGDLHMKYRICLYIVSIYKPLPVSEGGFILRVAYQVIFFQTEISLAQIYATELFVEYMFME